MDRGALPRSVSPAFPQNPLMRLLRSALLTLAFAAVASPALAQQETLKFTNSGSVTWNGVYVGPYQAQVTSAPGQPTIDIFCVDYAHEVSNGQTWNATFSNVMGDLSDTRLGAVLPEAQARAMYQQAAWLTNLYQYADGQQTKVIQTAIWQIMTPSFAGSVTASIGGFSFTTENLVDIAQTNYDKTLSWGGHTLDVDYSRYAVVTDVNFKAGGTQEFLTTFTPTPEPSTWLLMATGLASVGLFARRRKQQQS